MELSKMQIKDTIKKLRTDYKYTQVDLADKLNCNRQKIADWERGKSTPSTDDLILLARIFDTTTDYLLGISYVKTVNPEINSINYALGLSEQSIEKLNYLQKRAVGKEEAEELSETIEIAGHDVEALPLEWFEVLTKLDVRNATEEEIKSAKERIKQDTIEYIIEKDTYEPALVLEVLNDLIQKDDFESFMLALYVYLYSDTSELKTSIAGVMVPQQKKLPSDKRELHVEITRDLFIESYLLKINDYLRKWRKKGRIKLAYLTACEDYSFFEECGGDQDSNHRKEE